MSAVIAGSSHRTALWNTFAATDKKPPALEFRTLGRTGLKVTAVGMGVMNCSDPAVLLRAFDLGVNFYDTADCYMRGRNEEMVGKAFRGKRDRVFIQTKVHDSDEKKMRSRRWKEACAVCKPIISMFSCGTGSVRRTRFRIPRFKTSW